MTQTTYTISEWDALGRGVARHVLEDGRSVAVAIPSTIVGESVSITSIRKCCRGPVRRVGDLASIITPSPYRVSPRCPHVGVCGGCAWQHIDYQCQLVQKEQWVRHLFAPLGLGSSAFHPIIGCSDPWGYRNKMEFSFSQDREGKRFLGLFARQRRRTVFDLKECYLVNPWMAETLHHIREWWSMSNLAAYRPETDEGSLQTATMRESATCGDRMVILTVSGNPSFALKSHHLDEFVAVLRKVATPQKGTLSIVLRIRQIAKKMPTQFYEMILFGPDVIREVLNVETKPGLTRTLEFHISPQAFFQPNTLQAMKIYSKALQLAALEDDQVVYDLYCGIGVFGMFASMEARRAVGVELSRESAYDAKTNAQRLGLANFSIQTGDVATVVASMKKEGLFEPPSTVIVDPPRAGLMPAALEEIVSLEPKTIVYVSCNPETQARDAQVIKQLGWTIEAIVPIDQFPHTVHVENVLVARK